MKIDNVINTATVLFCLILVGTVAREIVLQFDFRDDHVNVAVEEVRVLNVLEKKSDNKEEHPVIGAIVGGLIAKTPGAIVGAAVGSNVGENGSSTVEISKLLGCTVVVRLPDQTTVPLRFGVHDIGESHRQLVNASLLRRGDIITVVCRMNKKSGEVIWYEWRGK